MVTDNSDKSDSKTIAGILISIAVVVIFVAFVMGVMGSNNSVQIETTRKSNVVENAISEQSFPLSENSGNNKTVLVPEEDRIGGFLVEAGSIKLKNFGVKQDDGTITQILPYNIDENNVGDLTIEAAVYGNYELDYSLVELEQWVNDHWCPLDGAKLYIDWVETYSVTHWPLPPESGGCGCHPDIWTGTFRLYDCNNPILAHSSYTPDGVLLDESDPKLVYMDITTYAEGCEIFTVILTHKNYFSGIPNSRNNI
ncbi:MAG: hypothetical protein ACFE8A_13645 [Candidatus Hodarchaeota archaeon]